MIELETERPSVAVTTEGQPSVVETYGNASFAHRGAAGKRDGPHVPTTLDNSLRQSRDRSAGRGAFRFSCAGAARFDLTRAGRGGEIIGKRCGWTQNIGKAARGGRSKR